MGILLSDKKVNEIERRATVEKISVIAAFLQHVLGQKLTAYLAGLNDPKVVGVWAQGKAQPRDLPAFRMRCAYKVASLLLDAYGAETTKSWFFGTNTRLDDEAPAYLLRHSKVPEDLRFIVPAAKAFILSAA